MGDVIQIEADPTELAADLLDWYSRQLRAGEVSVKGLMVSWVDEDGLVEYDHTENIGPESILAMIAPIHVRSAILLSADAWEGGE